MRKYALSGLLYRKKCFRRFFNSMRISVVMLFACAFASFASNANSQTAKVKIMSTQMTVGDFIEQVEAETDYMFVYNKKEIDADRVVLLKAGENKVVDCLRNIFEGSGISYVFEDDYIVLTKRGNKTMTPIVQQSGKTITGTIVDESGLPIIGANVVEKGTTNGTVTDMDGKFSLNVSSENAVVVVSYIGYIEQQLSIGTQKNWNLVLKEDSQSLDEVVVVGYGTQRKGNIATSVTTIKAETLQDRPVQTLGEALQGQVPGLSVTGSAAPGSSPTLQLRGSSVLNSNNSSSPLVLVDGVPADFNFLNPEDIESINVLKDAASSAIYGSRAANGVLLITTKRGKEGKPTFRYNGSVGVNTPMNMPETISSAQYARIRNEAAANMNQDPIYSADQIAAYEQGGDPRYPNTDWLDLVIQNSVTTRHGIEASGGTEKVKYIVSAGVDHQTGIFPQTQQNVFNVRSATDIAISKKFDVSFDIRYQLRDLEELGNQQDIYKQVIGADPTMLAYNPDGSYAYNAGFFTNPLVALYEGGQKYTNRHEASGLFKLNYEIIDGLTFTGIANVKYTFKGQEQRTRKLRYYNYFTQETFEKGENSFSDRRDQNAYYNLQALLNYKKSFGLHNLDILAGYQQGIAYVDNGTEDLVAYTNSFTDPTIGRDYAVQMIADGVDVIFGAAGGSSTGCAQAAQENGIMYAACDVHYPDVAPDSEIGSALNYFENMVIAFIEDCLAGNYQGGTSSEYGMAENAAAYEFADNGLVPEDIQKQVMDVAEKVKNGEFEISLEPLHK